MRRKGYRVDEGLNIVYIIGMDMDGTPNGNAPNKFNDLRGILWVGGHNISLELWPCTTEPGAHYVHSRINPAGAAMIKPGQYTAWHVGMHRGNHEALVQDGGPVTVVRDDNENFLRDDVDDTGYFGINQHGPSGHNEVVTNVGFFSAGCLVARSMTEHREFMKLVKTDPRYIANHQFVFTTTILEAKDVA